MKLSDLKKHIRVVKDNSIFTHGLSVGNHCVIDGPINSKDQLHIISHAHQDHVTDPTLKILWVYRMEKCFRLSQQKTSTSWSKAQEHNSRL